jgi:hemerythrin-like domain-containing protein
MAKAGTTRKRSSAARRTAKRTATVRRGTKTKPTKKTARSRKPATRKTAARPSRGAKTSRATRSRPSRAATSRLKSAAARVSRAVSKTVVAIAQHTPWAGGRNDAIELLEADHRRLEDLLQQGEETTERAVKTRTQLLNTITRELSAHELIEEKILYPALKAHPEARDIVLEGYQEHHVADLLVKELHALSKSDERWGAKFKVLAENIEHHIEEEEGKMFKTARAVFSRDELEGLGERMQTMKADALQQ